MAFKISNGSPIVTSKKTRTEYASFHCEHSLFYYYHRYCNLTPSKHLREPKLATRSLVTRVYGIYASFLEDYLKFRTSVGLCGIALYRTASN
jgi:hypothetical protein